MDKTDVILMGEDHHNGLGLVRSFGVNGINPYGIIICREKRSFIAYSKYWRRVFIAKDELDAVNILKKCSDKVEQKPVVMPWSDTIAAYLDKNYEELKRYFILPSINKQAGKIFTLMDKQMQTEFCQSKGLTMLPSKIVTCEAENMIGVANEIGFPVILKPVASVEGDKRDIKVCNSDTDLVEAASYMENRPYKRILMQKYLKQRQEFVITGFVDRCLNVFNIVSHIRQWPPNMGCGSFSKIISDGPAFEYAKNVMKKIGQAGYSGNIDVEFFGTEHGTFYLNEINWRSSGRNFISLYTGSYPAVFYYKYLTTGTISIIDNTKDGYTMNEATDFRYVLRREISLWKWLKDLYKTDSFAIWYWRDPVPTIIHYGHLIKAFCDLLMKRWSRLE